MKAAVLFEVNTPLRIVEVTLDPPKAGEARVRMKAAGICQSDWHMMNGDWPSKLPLVPGHEAAGIVEEVGPGTADVSVGDHVIFSFAGHCGNCRYCNVGRSYLCVGHIAVPRGALLDGTHRMHHEGADLQQMTRIGCFAQEVVAPAEMLVPIRKDMPFAQAALIGCSVATGIGSVTRNAKVEAGASVLVIGCGGVGLNVVQGAKLAGAGRIIAADILDSKLARARSFGATDLINAGGDDLVKRVKALTGGFGADYAFDTVATEKTLPFAFEAIAPAGRAVAVGVPSLKTQVSFSPFMMVLGEKTIGGAYYGSSRPQIDFPVLVDHYLAKRIDIDSLISRTYRLDEINEGFKAMMAGEVARGVVVFD